MIGNMKKKAIQSPILLTILCLNYSVLLLGRQINEISEVLY